MDPTLRNPARERLAAGDLALGVGIRQSRTVDIAAIMKACGYDWLFLDLEHNSMDLDTVVQISVAAPGAGIAPIVRVPAGQFWLATRVPRRAKSPIASGIRRKATARWRAGYRILATCRSAQARPVRRSTLRL